MIKQIYLGEVKKIPDPIIQNMLVDILWKYKGSNNAAEFGADVIKILEQYDFIEK